MAGWLTLMLVIAVAGREATRELAVFQVMEMRSLIGLLLLWPLVRAAGGIAALKTQRLRDHATRNTVHYAAQYAWFAALTMIPLAQVVAIEFTMPIWIILLAAAFLGERITRWKVLAVALGLCGVALIVRPSASGLSPGQLVALAAALGFAVSVTMVKSLTRHRYGSVGIYGRGVFAGCRADKLEGTMPPMWMARYNPVYTKWVRQFMLALIEGQRRASSGYRRTIL